MKDARSAPHWIWTMTLLLILLVAAGLRLYRLPELPLGLHYDEAANGILAGEIARGVKAPVFISSYTGKEVLFFYWAALWMKLLGMTPLALRLGAATIGLMTIAATVWAVRELLHGQRDAKWVALLTGAFLAASFWHLVLSRYGFRAVSQPLVQTLTVAALWRGLRLSGERTSARGLIWLILAGLFCGLTAYTYLAARAFPIPLAVALLTLLITDKDRRRARLGQLAIFVTAAALALAPLARYWLTHPGSFMTRANQVAAASWSQAWDGIRACLGMLFLRGDPYIRFNIPHRPLFDPLTAALFLLGLIAVIRPPRHPVTLSPCHPVTLSPRHPVTSAFLLTLLPTMLLPSALAVGEITPSNLRVVGLLPFIYLFPALGLSALKSAIARHLPFVIRHPSFVLLLLIILTPFTAAAYFGDWATSAALYYAADGDLVDAAAYLNQAGPIAANTYVASIHYRHPTLALLAEDYGAIRWPRGGETLVFPAEGDALLIWPHSTANKLAWALPLLPDDSYAPLAPDGEPAFHAYRIRPNPDVTPTHPLNANLAHIVQLLGYDVIGQPRSNGNVQVAVWWRVLNSPANGDYGPIARLTDSWGFAWGETQPFHYPSEQWTPGEVIVDRLTIPVAPGAPPGDYTLRFGLYSASADSQLPVLGDDGHYTGVNVPLPLQLARAATPPDPEKLPIRERLDAHVGNLILPGFNLDTSSARPGERLYLTLFWQADESPLPDSAVTLSLGDTILYSGAPVHGAYPFSDWAAGEVIADRYDLRLPRDTPPGDHPLRLRLDGPLTGTGYDLALDLDTVAVQAIDRVFDVPPISHPLIADLGNQVRLLGYDLSSETAAPGDTLTITLYWQALAEMDESYTVFTHLLAPDGSTTGQRDSRPVDGTYPTGLWVTGEVIADVYEIPIRADATPGEHRLEIGMYVAETGDRLPTGDSGDAVLLQSVVIEP